MGVGESPDRVRVSAESPVPQVRPRSLSRSLPRACPAASRPAKPQLPVFVPEKLSAAARTEHARRRGGPGVRKLPQLHGASHFGVACPGLAMGWAGVPGRATWVLAGGVLATALALPPGPGGRGWLPSGPGPVRRPRGAQGPLDPPAAPVAAPQRTSQVRTRPQSRVWLSPRREAPWSWGIFQKGGGRVQGVRSAALFGGIPLVAEDSRERGGQREVAAARSAALRLNGSVPEGESLHLSGLGFLVRSHCGIYPRG